MLNIGLLGLGTVGQGVVEIISKRKKELEELLNKKIRIKKILVKNMDKKRNIILPEDILTDNFNDIIEDDEIQLIIEATSSLGEGYRYVKEGLERGKHVVTANKAIVSRYFEELTALALENRVAFLYEASVAGGIPILKPLKEHIPLNRINEIQGILNGTCNYILTKMFEDDLDYDEALKIAQDLGYAESDPVADVEGYDTLRKLRILSSLGLQRKILEDDILLEGIDNIKSFDIEQIKKLNSVIKLIGEAKHYEDGYVAIVLPTIVAKDSYFSTINGAFNSISFKGDNVGELKFYGPGAGKLPTANAILTDVLDIGLNTYRNKNLLGKKRLKNYNYSMKGRFYLRIPKMDWKVERGLEEITEEILGQNKYIGIKTKEIELERIYGILRTLNIKKKEYFLGRFL